MKFVGSVGMLLLIVWMASCTSEQDLIKSEFRGIQWGAAPDAKRFSRTNPLYGDTLIVAERDSEVLVYHDVDLDEITYSFMNHRFFKAELTFAGIEKYWTMKQALENVYGTVFSENPNMNVAIWKIGDIVLKLNYYKMPQKGTLVITHMKYQ